jgi:hypothetical protein
MHTDTPTLLVEAPEATQPPAVRNRGWIVLLSILAGAALAALWSFEFVDKVIGDNVANTLLGHDAKSTAISGAVAGAVFAFVSGVAGTFTACNIAAFGALGPMMQDGGPGRSRLGTVLRPLGWLSLGMVAVSGVYGAVGALAGTSLPQLSTDRVGDGVPVRLLQASVVFGLIGLAFVYLGLVALRLAPDPLARLARRYPHAPLVVMGALIGGFLIGRPFPLFRKMFEYAVDQHNPFYGAFVFVLQSLGNIAIMAVLLLLLTYGTGGRLQRWMAANPGRAAAITAASFIVVGTFTVLYWDLRLPARFGYGWFPTAPWS